jgi:hypothetical protein
VRVRIRWQLPLPVFSYPLQPAPRTAVLVPCFRSHGSVRIFPDGWNEAVTRFAPEAIAGTLAQLDSLAGLGISPPSHAVIVLFWRDDPRLTDSDRERLWAAFRVPVFEQVISRRGILLATDCVAHGGLHLESPSFAPGEEHLDRSLCACGRKTPRLPLTNAGAIGLNLRSHH